MRNESPPPSEAPGHLDALIATRLLALRQAKGLSLAELAELSGVSKAMISKVERAQSSPTAVLLGRLAAGLGVSLAQLLTEEKEKEAPQRLRTKAMQEVWRDPEAGYLRRQVAERGATGSGVELVEVELPRSAQVGYPRWSGKPYRQCLWMLEGALRVDYGDDRFELEPGDCLDFGVDRPLVFKALGRTACRYLLVASAD
ncbi:transcriptional regulator with XRE-family HTH domain [Variovorax boronicumulans]|uniref:Transcriptional regulator with XRE-family HTH domain n=1 Tax=Variovorax boronicumulans TaxID=436515 RepID=A0AAW8CUL9_9BURK|nr:XRE family transcriptional regulator [Variovorax boronicumulans]MDP9891432.1 transcriptional regulator with XRE-family HTH domain [Variovorax boronicumulans]MDQ0040519.1 transcriptional regulator with XRE-family HTH domain [Variovorax boronicumulans]MDQ0051500.1 transcriptional regulator with XRE-family HTH domain [Variovorax boronicumulans]